MRRRIPNTKEILRYMHCSLCFETVPEGRAPTEWQQLEVGFTPHGLQVWCRRHDINIIHIDFEGQAHPANTKAQKGPDATD